LSIISCTGKKESEKIELFHSDIRLNDEYVGRGGDIISYNEGIIGIEESGSSAPLYVIDTVKNQLTAFGIRGQGPNDFLHPYPLQYIDEDKFGVYDMLSNTYKEVVIPKHDDTVRILNTIKMENRPFRVIKTAYNQYLGLSYMEGLLSLMDETGKELGTFFEYPYKDGNERSVKNNIRAVAYQGMLSSNPSGTKCIYTSLHGDIIHFYGILKDKILLIHKIENIFPQYQQKEKNKTMSDWDNIAGYAGVSATEKYVYALYCGKTFKELKKIREVWICCRKK
jgi:hypothetical protein